MKSGLSLLLLVTWLPTVGAGQAQQAVIQADRVVHCGVGTHVAVFEVGFAYQHIKDGCVKPTSESFLHSLKPQQVQQLLRLVADTRFFDLPPEITPEAFVTDEDVLIIRVRSEGRERSVTAFGLERARDREAADRFLALWRAIAKLAPEPK